LKAASTPRGPISVPEKRRPQIGLNPTEAAAMKTAHASARSLPRRGVATRHPALGRLLWQWLAVGALLVIAVPAARGSHAWLGSGPFWLVLAPLSSLLAYHRDAVAAAWRGILVPAPRRRLARGPGRQARRSVLVRSAGKRLRAA
jgi:hypothetical protein